MLRKTVARVMRAVPFPGRFRAYTYARKLFGDEPLPFTIPLRAGGSLSVASECWRHMYYLGDYEADVQAFLLAHCKPGDTVFDVGASIGICTVPLALRVGPAGRVFALEALRSNFQELMDNLARNRIANVESIFGAISDRPGLIEAPDIPTGNYSLATVSPATVTIPARTLDGIASAVDVIHLMKMDIEGSETKAFLGAKRLFAERRVKVALVEFNPGWLRSMGSSADELYDVWEAYDLQVSLLTSLGTAKAACRSSVMAAAKARGFINLVLRPKDNS